MASMFSRLMKRREDNASQVKNTKASKNDAVVLVNDEAVLTEVVSAAVLAASEKNKQNFNVAVETKTAKVNASLSGVLTPKVSVDMATQDNLSAKMQVLLLDALKTAIATVREPLVNQAKAAAAISGRSPAISSRFEIVASLNGSVLSAPSVVTAAATFKAASAQPEVQAPVPTHRPS